MKTFLVLRMWKYHGNYFEKKHLYIINFFATNVHFSNGLTNTKWNNTIRTSIKFICIITHYFVALSSHGSRPQLLNIQLFAIYKMHV